MSGTTKTRVVITGMGVVSPLGCNLAQVWKNLDEQVSGIRKISSLPMQSLPFQSGGECTDFTGAVEDYGVTEKSLQRSIKKSSKVMCREIEMGVAAAQKALIDSGLSAETRSPDRCGVLFGSDYILTRPEEFADGVRNCKDPQRLFHPDQWPVQGLPKVNPLWLLKYLPNMPNSHVAIFNDLRGPNNAITVREASMNLAVAESVAILQRGQADAMLVGATGSRIHPLRTAHVGLTEQMAGERSDPSQMARPFDISRDGMVVGEGAGALMLETLEFALQRGATIWGEIVGQGSSMVGPTAGRDNLRMAVAGALRASLRTGSERLGDRWHLHAHGLGTTLADASEALGISDAIGVYGDRVSVTCAKSFFGNLGAGAAAVELICSLLALKNDQLFPIKNLENPCPEATWRLARAGETAGQGFVHVSLTQQGQASSLAVAKLN
jgi:3-oxoacyl-[acyl-carrier-protein] synthase II